MNCILFILLLTFYSSNGVDWQDVSSCTEGKFDDCGGYEGYRCNTGDSCRYCNAIFYSYDCETCTCVFGSLAFYLILAGFFVLMACCCIGVLCLTRKKFL